VDHTIRRIYTLKYRLPSFLDNRLTDVGEVVIPTRRPHARDPQDHSCHNKSRRQGRSPARRIRSIKNSTGLNENRIRDLPACSTVLQRTTGPRTANISLRFNNDACLHSASVHPPTTGTPCHTEHTPRIASVPSGLPVACHCLTPRLQYLRLMINSKDVLVYLFLLLTTDIISLSAAYISKFSTDTAEGLQCA
jgi:hypothetical protein